MCRAVAFIAYLGRFACHRSPRDAVRMFYLFISCLVERCHACRASTGRQTGSQRKHFQSKLAMVRVNWWISFFVSFLYSISWLNNQSFTHFLHHVCNFVFIKNRYAAARIGVGISFCFECTSKGMTKTNYIKVVRTLNREKTIQLYWL